VENGLSPLRGLTTRGTWPFLRTYELRGKRDVGDGELFRIARETIQANRLFDPPVGDSATDYERMPRSKYG
jgi:hypothetical protein